MRAAKQNSEFRKKQIARATLVLVGREGLKGLTVAAVARQVGLVPSGIYRHFKNKKGMLESTIDLVQERLLGNVEAACNETSNSLEQLRRLLILHAELIRDNPGIPRVIFSEDVYESHPERKSKVYEGIRDYLGRIEEIVRRGQRGGEIRRGVDQATISMMFLGIVQPAAVLSHMSEGKFDVVRHVKKAWGVLCKAIRAR